MKIVSYHSNLYMDAFKLHLQEIKEKGFDTILFCITETDLNFNLETFQEFKVEAEKEGLKCWATYWGLYSGEAISKERNIPAWLTAVKGIGFRDIMIDEPKVIDDLFSFIDFDHVFGFHLCLTDDTFNRLRDDEIENLPVKSVGVSCYHWIKDWDKITFRTECISKRLKRLRPYDNFLFVQGFDIPFGWELIPLIVKGIAEINGIEDFGFWSFRCTEGTSSKRPVNHKQIWKAIKF